MLYTNIAPQTVLVLIKKLQMFVCFFCLFVCLLFVVVLLLLLLLLLLLFFFLIIYGRGSNNLGERRERAI